MAILGFAVLILIGIYLLIVAYGMACMEIGFGNDFPVLGLTAFLAAVGVFFAAYYFSPFTIRLIVS